MANRFSRGFAKSTYTPLTMQEIMTVPLAKQAQHDQLQAAIDEYDLLTARSLPGDKERASKILKGIQDEASGISDELMSGGINRGLVRKFSKLKSRKDREYGTEGFLGAVEANYDSAMKWREEMKKNASMREGWSQAEALSHVDRAISGFKTEDGVGGGYSVFSPTGLETYVDTRDWILEQLPHISEDIEDKGMLQYIRVNGLPKFQRAFAHDVTKSKSYNKIMKALILAAQGDVKLRKSLLQQAQFTGEKNPLDFGSFQMTEVVNPETGEKIINPDTGKVFQKEVWVPGKSSFSYQMAGLGYGKSYSNTERSFKFATDDLGLWMEKKRIEKEDIDRLIGIVNGDGAKVEPKNIKDLYDNFEVAKGQNDEFKATLDAYVNKKRDELRNNPEYKDLDDTDFNAVLDEELAKDTHYDDLKRTYYNSKIKYDNAKAIIDSFKNKVNASLNKNMKKVGEAYENLVNYNGNIYEAMKSDYGDEVYNMKEDDLYGEYMKKYGLEKGFKEALGSISNYLPNVFFGKLATGSEGYNNEVVFNSLVKRYRDRSNDAMKNIMTANGGQIQGHKNYISFAEGPLNNIVGHANKLFTEYAASNPFSLELGNKGGALTLDKVVDLVGEEDASKLSGQNKNNPYSYEVITGNGVDEYGDKVNTLVITNKSNNKIAAVPILVDNENLGIYEDIYKTMINSSNWRLQEEGEKGLASLKWMRQIKDSDMYRSNEGYINLPNKTNEDGDRLALKWEKVIPESESVPSYYTAHLYNLDKNKREEDGDVLNDVGGIEKINGEIHLALILEEIVNNAEQQ